MSRQLQRIADLVERMGMEVPVTLLVQGRVITGLVTQWAHYERWFEEVLRRFASSTGEEGYPAEIGPPSPDAIRAAVAAYRAEHPAEALREEGGFYSADSIVLRNATVEAAIPGNALDYPYLVISPEGVAGVTLGHVTRRPRGPNPVADLL